MDVILDIAAKDFNFDMSPTQQADLLMVLLCSLTISHSLTGLQESCNALIRCLTPLGPCPILAGSSL